ncbi:MAG: sigma 54-interacting transcriptional regulator [Planctomycetota bacterium]|jgi:diguanylate cyclase (GGDEF)-like protein
MPQLIQFAGGRSIVHDLKRKSTTVGRSTKANLRIRDRAASRLHFQIERSETGYKIVDLKSQNGTFVNGAQVNEERPLRVGDRIDAGMTTFFFGKVVRPPAAESAKSGADRFRTQKFIRPLDKSQRKLEVRRLLKEREQLLKMQRINRDLNSEIDLPTLLNRIMDAVLELSAAERGFLILAEGDDGGDLAFATARNLKKEEIESPEFQISRSIARAVLQKGEAVLTQNAEDDDRFREIASVRDRKLRSILCLPLVLKGSLLGVVYIDNPYQKGIFTEDDLEMLKGFADQVAVALHNAKLFDAAIRDAGTGLLGHAFFEKRITEILAGKRGPDSLVLVDLDRFKVINDLYGHDAGNRVLKIVAALLQDAAGEADALVARFGGDEFEVFLPKGDREAARRFAERLRRTLEKTNFPEGDKNLRLTLSAGVASFPADAKDAGTLLRRVDEALYRAKRLGRNRVEVYGAPGEARGGITGSPELDRLAFSRDGLMMMGSVARLLEADLTFDRVADILLKAALEGLDAEEAVLEMNGGEEGLVCRHRRGTQAGADSPDPSLVEMAQAALDGDGAEIPPEGPVPSGGLLTEILRGEKGVALGAIALKRPPERPFIEEDRELLRLFTGKAGRPLENALRFKASQEALVWIHRAFRDGVRQMQETFSTGGIVGKSQGLREVLEILEKIKDSELPVLIEGESGTGKELVARAIHFRSPRMDKVFLSENCAAIPESLVESEFFGHTRGAFTGADRDRKGLFEMADGGTLFLDEVGEMSLPLQARLLRVLQEGEIRPVGARKNRRVDVRIVAATNRDLTAMVESGAFRQDLYYRLNVVNVKIPPLRERREDIPLLVEYFLVRGLDSEDQNRKAFTPEALEILSRYAWPGNVRELMNEVARCAVLCPHAAIDSGWLSPAVRGEGPGGAGPEESVPPLKEAVEEMEKALIRRAMALCEGNKTHAAKMLGLSWLGLKKKLVRFGIS